MHARLRFQPARAAAAAVEQVAVLRLVEGFCVLVAVACMLAGPGLKLDCKVCMHAF